MRFSRSALVLGLGAALLAEPALAQTLEPVDNVLQILVDALTGTTARLVAIIAVAVIGLLTIFGRVEPRLFLMGFLGIAVIFGSAEIVDTLSGAAGAP